MKAVTTALQLAVYWVHREVAQTVCKTAATMVLQTVLSLAAWRVEHLEILMAASLVGGTVFLSAEVMVVLMVEW